jgi:hypothetical protein
VREDVGGGEALLGVDHEQLLDQVLGAIRDVVPVGAGEVVLACEREKEKREREREREREKS